MHKTLLIACIALLTLQCENSKTHDDTDKFPPELVHFIPYKNNPVFAGTGSETWDNQIRERGWIMREGDGWHLWYTGYVYIDSTKHLGYATSPDGFTWARYSDSPIYSSGWVEDMCVIKSDSIYYMFAEGRGDTAHMLTSPDRIHWTERGNLDIRRVNGEPILKGPYGTPSVFYENGAWYLLYERDDTGVWLATSKDLSTWTNIQDEPVLNRGPEAYDKYGVAMNQVIKYKGLYYGYYHATAFEDWHEWSTNVAVSKDLIHWKKYPNNPIINDNRSSGIMVNDGTQYRMYTMHPDVNIYFPAEDTSDNK